MKIVSKCAPVGGAPLASLIPLTQEFPYRSLNFFFHMAMGLNDPEVFSHIYWSRFEIYNLKILLFAYIIICESSIYDDI